MCRREKTLSELASYIPIYPQVLVNVPVRKTKSMEDFPSIRTAIKKAEKKLENGRILVRPSGTEPKIRVMIEGDNMDYITTIAENISEIIRKNMS
jgi:phosphoglucosamine mutase